MSTIHPSYPAWQIVNLTAASVGCTLYYVSSECCDTVVCISSVTGKHFQHTRCEEDGEYHFITTIPYTTYHIPHTTEGIASTGRLENDQ